ncbi:MAG: amino acid racemase [Candidatus Kerfeldbacteria bacterium]|nr:amino acid racemase [Candidatus Kerfeldbacteria bacterium]
MKRIGILGGLGPETTAEFYTRVQELVKQEERPDLLIMSLPISRAKEARYIAVGEYREYYREALLRGAVRLERSGCTEIVIPCNTVHEFHADIACAVKIPVANLLTIVAEEVKRRGARAALVLATSQTIRMRLYQNALTRVEVEVHVPSAREQASLDQCILALLSNERSKKAKAKAGTKRLLERIRERTGVSTTVLGCTDLQLVIRPSEHVVDSMEALAQYTANAFANGSR